MLLLNKKKINKKQMIFLLNSEIYKLNEILYIKLFKELNTSRTKKYDKDLKADFFILFFNTINCFNRKIFNKNSEITLGFTNFIFEKITSKLN